MTTGGSKIVLIAGGRGLIGKQLASQFELKGYRIRFLTRVPSPDDPSQYFWDPISRKIDEKALDGVEVLVNLAGENIAGKLWTPWRKRNIVNSRIFSTEFLLLTLQRISHGVKVLINASAIGYYGNTGEMIIHEDAPHSNDFLGTTCQRWEQSALKFEREGIRTVIFRIGLVLSRQGGILPELLKPIRFGIAPVFGSGSQYQSWIHIDDLCRMMVKAAREEQYSGIYNGVAPGPLSQRNFMKLLSQILPSHPILISIPAFFLRIALGEMSKMLTEGSRVSPEKMINTGFKYNYPQANLALRNLLGK